MDSCFPPLAALSLREGKKNGQSVNRHSSHGTNGQEMPRIEVLQDLDLYYIRQIAHNLKVA